MEQDREAQVTLLLSIALVVLAVVVMPEGPWQRMAVALACAFWAGALAVEID